MTNNSSDLHNKVALVTGSSSGIGAAIALNLAQRGASVVIHGRAPSDHLQSVFDQIVTAGGQARSVCGDFATVDDYDSFAKTAWDQFGRLDILVNNAGGDVLTGPWRKAGFTEKLKYLLEVDVVATLSLSRALGKMMVVDSQASNAAAGERSIINIGWDQAEQGMGGDSGEMFATTKGAIMAMTRSLAQSLAPQVRVNCVAPGWIQTDWGQQAPEHWANRAVAESLMNRWGHSRDVAQTVSFLASDDAQFIAGQIIPVNGGFKFFQGEQTDE